METKLIKDLFLDSENHTIDLEFQEQGVAESTRIKRAYHSVDDYKRNVLTLYHRWLNGELDLGVANQLTWSKKFQDVYWALVDNDLDVFEQILTYRTTHPSDWDYPDSRILSDYLKKAGNAELENRIFEGVSKVTFDPEEYVAIQTPDGYITEVTYHGTKTIPYMPEIERVRYATQPILFPASEAKYLEQVLRNSRFVHQGVDFSNEKKIEKVLEKTVQVATAYQNWFNHGEQEETQREKEQVLLSQLNELRKYVYLHTEEIEQDPDVQKVIRTMKSIDFFEQNKESFQVADQLTCLCYGNNPQGFTRKALFRFKESLPEEWTSFVTREAGRVVDWVHQFGELLPEEQVDRFVRLASKGNEVTYPIESEGWEVGTIQDVYEQLPPSARLYAEEKTAEFTWRGSDDEWLQHYQNEQMEQQKNEIQQEPSLRVEATEPIDYATLAHEEVAQEIIKQLTVEELELFIQMSRAESESLTNYFADPGCSRYEEKTTCETLMEKFTSEQSEKVSRLFDKTITGALDEANRSYGRIHCDSLERVLKKSKANESKKKEKERADSERVHETSTDTEEVSPTGTKEVTENYAQMSAEEISKKGLELVRNYAEDPQMLADYLAFMGKFSDYSPRNVALIQKQWPGANAVATFDQWKKLGERLKLTKEDVLATTKTFKNKKTGKETTLTMDQLSVQTGEKAQITLFRPLTMQAIPAYDGKGQPIIDKETKKAKYKPLKKATDSEKSLIKQGRIKVVTIPVKNKQTGKPVFTTYKVFELSQTNLKAEAYPKIAPNRPEIFEIEEKLVPKFMAGIKEAAKKIHVRFKDDLSLEEWDLTKRGNAKGFFIHQKDSSDGGVIVINPRNTLSETIKTSFHELTHAALHHTYHNKQAAEMATSQKELEAELSSYVVCKHFGIDTEQSSIRYLAKWTKNLSELDDWQLEYSMRSIRKTSADLIKVIDGHLHHPSKEMKQAVEQQKPLGATFSR